MGERVGVGETEVPSTGEEGGVGVGMVGADSVGGVKETSGVGVGKVLVGRAGQKKWKRL